MKKLTVQLLSIFFVANTINIFAQPPVAAIKIGETHPTKTAYIFGTGEQLSGQQFQTEGIMTYKGYQYTVYYNINRNVCIARRKMPLNNWKEVVLPYRNSVDDAHNVVSMGICHGDGSIHLAMDHHNDTLNYCYSVKGSANHPDEMPWQADSFSPATNFMDDVVPDVTYPRFISKPDGNLLFECRFHYSGYGDSYLREYNASTKVWTLIGRYIQGMDVTPDACAYINGMTYDNQGRLHITWCWRDDFGGGSNHDFYYSYSEDDGRTWLDNTGVQVSKTQLMTPIVNRNTGTCLTQKLRERLMIEEIPYNKGYINQETQAVDSQGRIHAVNSHIPMNEGTDPNWTYSRKKARLHHRYRDEDGSWKTTLIKSNGVPVHSYCRVNLSFDAYDNAYILANGAEIYTAIAEDDYQNWYLLSNIDAGRFLSEPLVDRSLLISSGILSFVYLGADKKITVIDYLLKNPNTPSGKGLKVEYFSDKNLNTSISSKIASPEQNSIPKGTNSIRWSGAFETLEGEEYYLYITTPDKISIYINDRSVEPTKHDIGKQEYEFKYELIPSHKNNILIETKGKSPLKLSWSSKNTPKETIPITSLYPEKSY